MQGQLLAVLKQVAELVRSGGEMGEATIVGPVSEVAGSALGEVLRHIYRLLRHGAAVRVAGHNLATRA